MYQVSKRIQPYRDWGRCLHVESVERNTLFQYVMKEVYPS